jgi:hypothetical protein
VSQHGIKIGRCVRQHTQQNLRGERRHHLVRDRALQLRGGFAAGQRLGAGSEVEEYWRDIGEGQAERAENHPRMLGHAALLRADHEAPAPQIGHRAQIRIGASDEEQRPGIHRRHHAQIDFLRERRLAGLGAADPVRRHEAEVDVVSLEPVGVLHAGVRRRADIDRRQRRHAVEHRLERKTLTQKRAVRLRRADAHVRHVIRL